jgi:hypothetical protein
MREALSLEPNGETNYPISAACMAPNRPDEAEPCTTRPKSKLRAKYYSATATLAFLKGDAAKMAQMLSSAGKGYGGFVGRASGHGSLVRQV